MEIKFYEHPKFDDLVLIASLPDMGRVGGLVPEFLIDHLGATLFAEISSYNKSYVLCKDGLITHAPSIYRVYYSRKGSLIIMTGDDQPTEVSELYALCNSILDIVEKIGRLRRVYTTGGYSRESVVEEPKVFGVTNMPHLLRELDRLNIREMGPEISTITWFNGLLLGIALSKNIEGIGLFGEIDNPSIPQPRAAQSVLKAINTLLSAPEIEARKRSEAQSGSGGVDH